MSLKNEKPVAPVAPIAQDNDLREQIAALTATVNTLAIAALTPRARVSRKATVSAVALSPVATFCAQAGFREGSARNRLFSALFALLNGEKEIDVPLADFPYANTGDAQVIARRISPSRKNLPFSLAVDGEERGAARLIFRDLRETA
jgi:hypothetical protein